MNDETMREAFEKWVRDEGLGLDLKIVHEGRYFWHETANCFLAYQAGMNTRAQASAPEGVHESAGVVLDEYRIAKYRLADKKAMENSDQWSHADEVSCMQTALDKCGYTRSNAKAGEVDDGWMPIDSAPQNSIDVLVWINKPDGSRLVARTPGTGIWWDGMTPIPTPSHWRHIP